MLKPFARSTITKKYRATRISSDIISTVRDYLNACANFYYILEMDEAKRIILDRVDITEEQFDTLLPILMRDDDLEGYIVADNELYSDGDDNLYIISKEYLTIPNEDFDVDEYIEKMDNFDSDYDGPPAFDYEWERFYPLFEAR